MLRRPLYVPITEETRAALVRRATTERRRPQDEAALIIERALGALVDDVVPTEARSVDMKVRA